MPNRLVGMVWASAVWCGETEVDVCIIASYHIYTWLLSQDFYQPLWGQKLLPCATHEISHGPPGVRISWSFHGPAGGCPEDGGKPQRSPGIRSCPIKRKRNPTKRSGCHRELHHGCLHQFVPRIIEYFLDFLAVRSGFVCLGGTADNSKTQHEPILDMSLHSSWSMAAELLTTFSGN